MSCQDATKRIQHKRGDTFQVEVEYLDENNVPQPLTNYSIDSRIKDISNILISTLVVTKANQEEFPGKYTLRASDTSSWPVDVLLWDIQYSFDDTKLSTETLEIIVTDSVTA